MGHNKNLPLLFKITGKRMDDHNFVPLLEPGKKPDCCTSSSKATESHHNTRNDFKYVTPVLKKEALEKCDQKSFEDLQKVSLKHIAKQKFPLMFHVV